MTDARLKQVENYFSAATMNAALNALRGLPGVWIKMPEASQEAILAKLREDMDRAIQEGVRRLLANGFNHIEVGLESVAVKSSMKCVIQVSDPNAVHDLVDHVQRKVVLVLVDPSIYAEGLEAFKADPDQPSLPLTCAKKLDTDIGEAECLLPSNHTGDCEFGVLGNGGEGDEEIEEEDVLKDL